MSGVYGLGCRSRSGERGLRTWWKMRSVWMAGLLVLLAGGMGGRVWGQENPLGQVAYAGGPAEAGFETGREDRRESERSRERRVQEFLRREGSVPKHVG